MGAKTPKQDNELTSTPRILTVTEVASLVNVILEDTLSRIEFKGEIFELNLWSSGHLYFTLKDEQSQLNCVMWRSSFAQLGFKPIVGDEVNCVGRPNLYHKNGRFQLIVTSMLPAGAGLLQKKFLELKAKLEQEGLFESARKRPLPPLPRCIGIVTSAQGAVIHDIMVRVRERMPHLIVYLVDVKVQGPGAAEEIAAGIERLNRKNGIEVIIVARGGGSLEDLWAFNEEKVVRAIFASRIPVVSGVGHEVDVTLSDLVADVRAPTPTAAAEIVVPRCSDLLRHLNEFERRLSDVERWLIPRRLGLDELEQRLVRIRSNFLQRALLRLSHAEARIKAIHPRRIFELQRNKIKLMQERCVQQFSRLILNRGRLTAALLARLQRMAPHERIRSSREQSWQRKERLARALKNLMHVKRDRLNSVGGTLQAISPERVLERGYAVVHRQGVIVRDAAEIAIGENTEVSFASSSISVTVAQSYDQGLLKRLLGRDHGPETKKS